MARWYTRVFSIEINFIMRNIKSLLMQKRPKIENSQSGARRVFMLDMPEYVNMGDQAIALAMRAFVEKYLPECEIFEIEEDLFPKYIRWLKKNVNEEDIICLTGGGNMGTMYQRYEAIRRIVVRMFCNNRIFVFPQTVTDKADSLYSRKEWKRAKRVYEKAVNLTIMAREQASYDFLKSRLSCDILAVPDIALFLNNSFPINENRTDTVGICLREDNESVLTSEDKERIKSSFPKVEEFDTVLSEHKRINSENRRETVERMLQMFVKYRLVVTDRLHGLIFSYLTNTPCIIQPSKTGKVESIIAFLKGNTGAEIGIGKPVSYAENLSAEIGAQFETLGQKMRGIVYGPNEEIH